MSLESRSRSGKEIEGKPEYHAFLLFKEHKIEQRFSRIGKSKSKGKAERPIRTMMKMRHEEILFFTESQYGTDPIGE